MPKRSRRRSGRKDSPTSEEDFSDTSQWEPEPHLALEESCSDCERPGTSRESRRSRSSPRVPTRSRSRSAPKQPPGRPKGTPDLVWEEFKSTSDPEMMECRHCGKRIKVNKGSKSGLLCHMRFHRKAEIKVVRDSLKSWLVASMVTVLRIPMNAFNHLIMTIIFWLARLGPINSNMARKYTDMEARKAKELLATDLDKLRQEGSVFTLTLDEWSYQRKRFLGVTLHSSSIIPCVSGKSIQLLSRFRTRATAKNLEAILVETLESVGLRIMDIRGITTDAAQVMKKLGKSLKRAVAPMPFFHQLCFAHGIHLAVVDTFKCNKDVTGAHEEIAEEGNPAWNIVEITQDCDSNDVQEFCELEEQEEFEGAPVFRGPAGVLVDKVRQVCLKFQNSPVSHDELLQTVPQRSLSQVKLVTDMRTRWNSTLRMLRNFVALVENLRAHFCTDEFPVSESELSAIKDIISTLTHVETCIKRLSMSTTTMRDADIAMKIMIRGVKAEPSEFARCLEEHLCIRLLQRRGAPSTLSIYVADYEENTELDQWLENTSERIIRDGNEALCRTFIQQSDLAAELSNFQLTTNQDQIPTTAPESQEASREDDEWTNRVIKGQRKAPPKKKPQSAEEIMKLHTEGYSTIPPQLVATLQTLQPTSVPAERVFSIARHLRRYSQECQDDERYSNYVFLSDFYRQTQPWRVFKDKYIMSQPCNITFASEEDSSLDQST